MSRSAKSWCLIKVFRAITAFSTAVWVNVAEQLHHIIYVFANESPGLSSRRRRELLLAKPGTGKGIKRTGMQVSFSDASHDSK